MPPKITKERVDQILSQAKESVKLLESIQKEGLSKAQEYLKKSPAFLMALEKEAFSKTAILKKLKKLGIATKEDVRELNDKVDDLASELRMQISKMNRKDSAKSGSKEA